MVPNKCVPSWMSSLEAEGWTEWSHWKRISLEEGNGGQVPEIRMQYGVITMSLVWVSLGLSALDTFLWGHWLLASYGQGARAEECPHLLLISLLKHKDLYTRHKYTSQTLACASPLMSTNEDIFLHVHRHNQAPVQRPSCKGRCMCFRHSNFPVLAQLQSPAWMMGSRTESLPVSFLCT